MKMRFVVLTVAAVSGALACSVEREERPSTVEQPLEGACDHAVCATGAKLDSTCDPCATKLCAADPYCCGVEWDATCVGEVTSICGQSCTITPTAGDTDGGDASAACAHPICASGGALDAACDPCATKLCAADPYCCGVAWDATCVGEVTAICGLSCK